MLQVLDSNGNGLHFNDDHSGDCESGNNQYASHLETELQIGQQYKLKINGYSASSFGSFEISVSCPSSWSCSNHACFWSDYTQGTDWDYYQGANGDCIECQRLCAEDLNCWAVECGDNYCSWWANGVCERSDATAVYFTCRARLPE